MTTRSRITIEECATELGEEMDAIEKWMKKGNLVTDNDGKLPPDAILFLEQEKVLSDLRLLFPDPLQREVFDHIIQSDDPMRVYEYIGPMMYGGGE